MHPQYYRGNINLKRENTPTEYTPEMVAEWIRCAEDPIYFAENYIKVVTLDDGFVNINLYDYQRDIIQSFQNYRNTIVGTSRQVGKCCEKSTLINVKNTKTGEIQSISIGDFYERAKKQSL